MADTHMNAAPGDVMRRPRMNPTPSEGLVPRNVDTKASVSAPSAASPSASSASRECCTTGSFVTKLYKMVDTEPATIVSWIRGGTAFCIVDPKMMAEHCLPKYFRHRRFSSLIRQLNFYSFYRVQEGQLTIYQHSYFRKGRPDLLVHIKRRGAGKAKDPWFDPLSPASKPPMPLGMHDLMVTAPMDMLQVGMVSPHPMMCYSPMAKPLPAACMDNMSPALKPTLATAVIPPTVDLGGKMMMDMDSQRWDPTPMLDLDETKFQLVNAQMQMKPTNVVFPDNTAPNGAMVKPMMTSSLDMDIQDFLTEECAIVPDMIDDSQKRVAVAPAGMNAKRAMVARDFMKWDAKEDEENEQSNIARGRPIEPVDSFERELLLDLATVEPGAWDVPLSPLNDEEDMMPWLDLCL